ncbi:hypothetical protein AMS68_004318 [Peltaster fructicola]|uniref:Uncharacterized protein n=1 Tax=Peltaster fructicola TaxID=286661 RepID=A0A6H0XVW4_9PEZI|nr:hypothetical protein AMS68_004318 [Peltaster fructicola]
MEYVPAHEMIGSARRTSVAASSTVSVPTPSRDLSFRRGAYTKNIARLEQSAEEMSAGGSDIGEEIRRMNEAERRSRQNSIQSEAERTGLGRANSSANSIVDLNSVARAGGFSPGAFVTSPVGSVHSRTSIHRQISTDSKSSRLADMWETDFEDRPLELALGTHDFSRDDGRRQSTQLKMKPAIDTPISAVLVNHADAMSEDETRERGYAAAMQEDERQERGYTGSPPPRPSSTDTYQQAQTAFMDFDGVHCSSDMEEYIQLDQDGNEVRRISGRSSTGTAMIPSMPLPAQVPLGAPPPDDGMVFYPAPVPRMLNLPKRLSQLPAASVQAKRRTQAMSQMYAPTRNSAAWLSQGISPADNGQPRLENPRGQLNERLSVANFSNVPPQLRASVFFEHQTVVHDVDVKSESAVATLDSILAASATAPVSAFTDHPYAGDISKTAYAPERNRRSTANDLRMSTAGPNRKSNLSMLKRASPASALGTTNSTYTLLDADGRKSQMSLGAGDDSKRLTRMPLSGDILEEPEDEEEPDIQLEGPVLEEDDEEANELREIDQFDDDEDIDPDFVQPTTLLAELQVRKAQLKSRNRTAATAFPNGMHSTLLELDAVAAINKKKRSNQRVALAWEDPNLKQDDADPDAENEDVPLGMLFPGKNGLMHRKMGDTGDWDRPLGLMEKRQMEDEEPLSSRRSRLRGEPIRPRPTQPFAHMDMRQASGQSEVEGEDGQVLDEEALKDRLRRISTKEALDGAIQDVVPQDGSRPLSTFADDVISQLNIGDGKKTPAAPEDIENETLGQRRARLQREKDVAARASMSNLLAANPVGQRQTSREHVSTRGTLLFANEQAQAEHKRNMLASNMRTASFGAPRPPLAHAQSAVNMMPLAYNGYGMQSSVSTPMFGMQPNAMYGMQSPGYFTQQPMAGYGMRQGMMNPYAYNMLAGQPQVYGMQQGVYPMGYNHVQVPTLQQRSAIDQWRSNIAQ